MDGEATGERKRLRILVVDDEPRIREVIQMTLEREGYVVSSADSGVTALEAIQEFRPNLVLLDIRMPDMDGIQCLRRIKDIDSDIEVIMISGFATLEIARRSLELGAFDYISKPLNFDHVRGIIRHITVTRFVELL